MASILVVIAPVQAQEKKPELSERIKRSAEGTQTYEKRILEPVSSDRKGPVTPAHRTDW